MSKGILTVMRARWAMLLILAVFSGLFGFYATNTPYRQPGVLANQRDPQGNPARVQDVGAPDERQHANYVRRLLDGRGLPVLQPGSPDLYETYQSHQPPLYYLLAAAWSKIAGSDPADPGSGSRLRWLGLVFGATTIVGAYLAGLWATDRKLIGLGAAIFVGWMPMFVALSAAVSNDPLLIALCTWVFALLVRHTREGWNVKGALWLGVLTGLALLTKSSALALLPTIFVAGWLGQRPSKKLLAIALGLPVLIAIGWWIRNTQLYGDPLGLTVFKQAFVGTAQRSDMVQMVAMMREAKGLDPSGATFEYWTQWFGWWTLRSFFGVFGQMDIFLPDTLYRVGAAIVGLAGVGWVFALRRERERQDPRPAAWVGLSLFLVVVLQFLQFNLTYFQAQGRYLYPAIAPIAVGFAVGFWRIAGRREWAAIASAVIVTLVLQAASIREIPRAFELRTEGVHDSATRQGP